MVDAPGTSPNVATGNPIYCSVIIQSTMCMEQRTMSLHHVPTVSVIVVFLGCLFGWLVGIRRPGMRKCIHHPHTFRWPNNCFTDTQHSENQTNTPHINVYVLWGPKRERRTIENPDIETCVYVYMYVLWVYNLIPTCRMPTMSVGRLKGVSRDRGVAAHFESCISQRDISFVVLYGPSPI
jgi:hypothetical protein